MATTHSTPFLRQQALPVLPIIETEEILEDLEGLTLPDHLLTKHGYRTQPFTDSDLNEMRHCKTCGRELTLFQLYFDTNLTNVYSSSQ